MWPLKLGGAEVKTFSEWPTRWQHFRKTTSSSCPRFRQQMSVLQGQDDVTGFKGAVHLKLKRQSIFTLRFDALFVHRITGNGSTLLNLKLQADFFKNLLELKSLCVVLLPEASITLRSGCFVQQTLHQHGGEWLGLCFDFWVNCSFKCLPIWRLLPIKWMCVRQRERECDWFFC